MPDVEPTPRLPRQTSSMFAEPVPERAFPSTAVAIAATAIVILAIFLVLLGRRHPAPPPGSILPAAPYASNLVLTDVHMSDATTGSGGHLIYVEGHIANRGPSTVSGITVQTVFANDVAMPPQVENLPLSLIYMREPYVDARPVSAAPMAPGAESDFRLIFDDINDSWNQQLPQIKIIEVAAR